MEQTDEKQRLLNVDFNIQQKKTLAANCIIFLYRFPHADSIFFLIKTQ